MPCQFLPELLPVDAHGNVQQVTENIIGPYELHDYFLYHMVRYGERPAKILYMAELAFNKTYDRETILQWLEVFVTRFFSQQFKRSAMPDGPQGGIYGIVAARRLANAKRRIGGYVAGGNQAAQESTHVTV